MKKLVTLLFAAALVTAASAQSGDRYRNDSRNDNSYQSSPYLNNDQYSYQDQHPNVDYYNRNLQRNDRYYKDRQQMARQRYEYEMMMRRRQALNHQRMYDNYPYGITRKPSLQIRIGIGGRRY